MRVDLQFASEELTFDVPEDRLIAAWSGPPGRSPGEMGEMVRLALEAPLDFPPLRDAVVPGDRVALAWDSRVPEPLAVLSEIARVLESAGVEGDSLRIVTTRAGALSLGGESPLGKAMTVHDPGDEAASAYLASTSQGLRVYLNRQLTDADVVVAVGRIGFDPTWTYRGPWSALYPDLGRPGSPSEPKPDFNGIAEASWLLGSPFQVGILDGVSGPFEILAGVDSAVRARGVARLEEFWSLRADRRAGLVVAGVGPSAGIDDLALGLESACRLVRRGGKVVLLGRVPGPLGRACRRILDLDDPRSAASRLRGHEAEPDYSAARRISEAMAWADVYVLSGLGDEADDLFTAALERPEEARRLVSAAESVIFLGSAENTKTEVVGDD